jgi:two-component system OmpR family response regulator
MSSTLLIVEDDPDIRHLVADLLRRHGFDVETAQDAVEMEAALRRTQAHLLVLDLMLPGEDGLSVCRRLRAQQPALPILMLTAKGEEIDRVVGLEMGADDYLVKPFSPRELLARVRALLRRGALAPAQAPQRRLCFDAFTIDLDTRQLMHASEGALTLTGAEFDLLACFVQRPRRVLTRDEIVEWTRGRAAEPLDRTVDMLVSRVRRKLDAASPGTRLITTVRNGGYLLTAQVKPAALP